MPTYEYRCPNGHDFEKFYRKISDAEPEVTCPECGLVAERRMSAGAGLVFKGSGFYITDYGKDGKKDQAKSPPSESKGASESTSPSTSPSPSTSTSTNKGSDSTSGSGSSQTGSSGSGTSSSGSKGSAGSKGPSGSE